MRITKAINLTFTASPTTTAYVSVPFKVKTVHVKSAAYNAGTNGTTRYVYVVSDLVGWQPLGILNQDTTYSSGTISDVQLDYMNPQVVQGSFTFQLNLLTGALAGTTNNGAATDTVALIVEFNSDDEPQ